MLSIFKSLLFFISLLIKRKYVDIIFYYPSHFNRGKDKRNYFFNDLIISCKKHNISYLIFEEPDYKNSVKRDDNSIPFDFIYLIIVLLRKFTPRNSSVIKDQKIGTLINKFFLGRLSFKKFITISQSMLSVFRGINEKAELYDLQHGIIYNNKKNYLVDGNPEDNLFLNKAFVLVHGDGFKSILVKNDSTDFFRKKTFSLGTSYSSSSSFIHENTNKNILVTLQFTSDHTPDQNKVLLDELTDFILNYTKYTFYLKSHPRFNNEINLKQLLCMQNVKIASDCLNDCFRVCSLHSTFYSTTAFEASLHGIPTVFIKSRLKFINFEDEFNYPLLNNLRDYSDTSLYKESSKLIKNWSSKFYMPYNENIFIKLFK